MPPSPHPFLSYALNLSKGLIFIFINEDVGHKSDFFFDILIKE